MAGKQSTRLNPQAGDFTPNSSHITPSFPTFGFPANAPTIHNEMHAAGDTVFKPVTPASHGWTQVNHQPDIRMGYGSNGQYQQRNYSHHPTKSRPYAAHGQFQEHNYPHCPITPLTYGTPGQSQQRILPGGGPLNRIIDRSDQTGNNFHHNQTPSFLGLPRLRNPLFNHNPPAVAPAARGPVPPPSPASREPMGRYMGGFSQMANPLFNQSMPATPALYDPFTPNGNGRRSLTVANKVTSCDERGRMADPIYVYQPLPVPTPSPGTKPPPTPAQQSRGSSMSSAAHSNGRRSDSGSDETERNGREANGRGRGGDGRVFGRGPGGKERNRRGPPKPHQELPLDAKDLVPGAIVWLHKPEPWHEEVLCVQNHDCVDPRKVPDGHNHPVLILRENQRKGSDKIGDLILDVAPVSCHSFPPTALFSYHYNHPSMSPSLTYHENR